MLTISFETFQSWFDNPRKPGKLISYIRSLSKPHHEKEDGMKKAEDTVNELTARVTTLEKTVIDNRSDNERNIERLWCRNTLGRTATVRTRHEIHTTYV